MFLPAFLPSPRCGPLPSTPSHSLFVPGGRTDTGSLHCPIHSIPISSLQIIHRMHGQHGFYIRIHLLIFHRKIPVVVHLAAQNQTGQGDILIRVGFLQRKARYIPAHKTGRRTGWRESAGDPLPQSAKSHNILLGYFPQLHFFAPPAALEEAAATPAIFKRPASAPPQCCSRIPHSQPHPPHDGWRISPISTWISMAGQVFNTSRSYPHKPKRFFLPRSWARYRIHRPACPAVPIQTM